MSEVEQKGIGAALHVNAETKIFRTLFSQLGQLGIDTVDPKDAHITIVDCAETKIPIFSPRDQISLNRARSKAGSYLSTIPMHEIILSPSQPKLEVFGKRIGVRIEETEQIGRFREYLGEIFDEVAGISLSNRNFEPHLSVGLKINGMKGAIRQANKSHSVKIPTSIHVNGFDVSERNYVENSGRMRSNQQFSNKPRTLMY